MGKSLCIHVFVFVSLALVLAFPMLSMLTFEAKAQLPSTFTKLASGTEILCIAVDSTYVYFAEYGTATQYLGNVSRAPIAGGTVETLVTGERTPWKIVLDGDYIYYIAHDAGRIMKLAKQGGTPQTLASGLNHPYDIAVSSNYVYFTERDNGQVKRVPIDGGDVQILTNADYPLGLSLDSEYTYFAEGQRGNIKKVPSAGGNAEIIASGLNAWLQPISVDADNIYFAENNITGRVGTVSKSGGTVTILASGLDSPFWLVTDSNYVYFTEYGAGNVRRIPKTPKTGGSLQTLVSGLDKPSGIAVNSDYLFFSDDNGVYKIAISEPTGYELLYLAIGLGTTTAVLSILTVYFYRKSHLKTPHQPNLVKSNQTKCKICPKCGTNLPADSKFCGKCGTSLE